jgi:hypothetical protein
MCYLRGDCRPGDFGEQAIDKNGSDAKHEKQEKMRGFIWARPLIPRNTTWYSARFVMGKENYPRNPGVLMFAEDVEDLDLLKKNLKSSKRWKIESQ